MKVIFSSFHTLEGHLTLGDHHYLREFLRDGAECFWISGMVNSLSLLRRPGRTVREWKRVWDRPRTVATPHGDVPEWVAGGVVPYREAGWHRGLRPLGGALYPRARATLRRAGFGEPDILWLGNLRTIWLADLFPGALVVHRVGDRLSGFAGAAADTLRLQRRVVERADVVVATAQGLIEDLADVRGDITLIPNGVETERFAGPLPPEPPALAPIPHPRVLYLGAIEEWFDWSAVAAMARARDDVQVVLVGPMRGTKPPADLPANVHLMGPCAYTDVPAWVRHCDAGTMPFKRNDLTEEVSPLKVFEYLAAGLPVVSLDLRATRALDLPVTLVPDAAGFEAGVAGVLTDPGDPQARIDAVAAHDWSARYRTLKGLIDEARAAKA